MTLNKLRNQPQSKILKIKIKIQLKTRKNITTNKKKQMLKANRTKLHQKLSARNKNFHNQIMS